MKIKIALITGGSKGIGYGIAEALVKQGMYVAITSRNLTEVNQAAERLNALGYGKAMPFQADVRDFPKMQETVNAIVQAWGGLDVVVANAGIGHFGPVESLSLDQWNETIDINLTGAFHTLKASLQALKDSKGYYITISSLAGTNFFAGGTAYNASKFGLTGFTQAVMLDLRKYGIKVTTIMPGSVATYFGQHQPNEGDHWKIQIEDLGQMVVDLIKMNPRTLPSKIEVRPSQPQ